MRRSTNEVLDARDVEEVMRLSGRGEGGSENFSH